MGREQGAAAGKAHPPRILVDALDIGAPTARECPDCGSPSPVVIYVAKSLRICCTRFMTAATLALLCAHVENSDCSGQASNSCCVGACSGSLEARQRLKTNCIFAAHARARTAAFSGP